MKKRLGFTLAAAIIVVIVVSAFAAIETYNSSSSQAASKKPFYVGVTYCGNSTTEAEQLIDKVKNYTNLFVVQSGPLMTNLTAMEQICDYAVNSGLNIIVYYAHNGDAANTCDSFLDIAQARWGSHFLGLYYNDEPGGKMLDNGVNLYDSATGTSIVKNEDGSLQESYDKQSNNITTQYDYTFLSSGEIDAYITITFPDSSNQFNTTTYFTNGTISLSTMYESAAGAISFGSPLWYQPNGIVQDENGTVVTDAGKISQFEPYQQLWDSRPLQTYADAANLYVSTEQNILGSVGNQSSVTLFTSDYGLDWFDYQAGYDVVLGQLGWNQSTTQNIALVRGGADMQNKSWGTMITWASLTAPYLQSGDEMYNAMCQSYESGAEYVVVFNYAGSTSSVGVVPNSNGTSSDSGLLQDPQFAAIQKFWTDIVQNPKETNNVKAQDALVLPQDYGWGMRSQNDTIWGLWQPDNSSQQVWSALQASLGKYGSKLDIVYDDPAYPTAGRYQHVCFWNQTD
jgi:hypothetical protein